MWFTVALWLELTSAAGNLPHVGFHPRGIKVRAGVHRDRISFTFSRGPLASLLGGRELRRRPSPANDNPPTFGGQRTERASPVYGDRPVQRAALSRNAQRQGRDVVHRRVDHRAQRVSEFLYWQRGSVRYRRPEWAGNLRPRVAWKRVYPGRRAADPVNESRRRVAIQDIRVRHADLPLSAHEIVKIPPTSCVTIGGRCGWSRANRNGCQKEEHGEAERG